jgi:hypothetical protein
VVEAPGEQGVDADLAPEHAQGGDLPVGQVDDLGPSAQVALLDRGGHLVGAGEERSDEPGVAVEHALAGRQVGQRAGGVVGVDPPADGAEVGGQAGHRRSERPPGGLGAAVEQALESGQRGVGPPPGLVVALDEQVGLGIDADELDGGPGLLVLEADQQPAGPVGRHRQRGLLADRAALALDVGDLQTERDDRGHQGQAHRRRQLACDRERVPRCRHRPRPPPPATDR